MTSPQTLPAELIEEVATPSTTTGAVATSSCVAWPGACAFTLPVAASKASDNLVLES